ncbi:hypothetical protein [Neobacillus cucumis]|uniref:hypothetical protein n=1 Tax=Neobacillus cucumis TaxID=1740721 RepID=UPI001964276C|nr:hypothetical protein [Neobacillus cucumis]MBM7656340.1 hypothetical protein [Neobacillus cucumis]
MKNVVSMLLATFLFVTPCTFDNAEENAHGNKNVKEIYATPNDMFLDFIQIKADKVIQIRIRETNDLGLI